MSAEQEDYYAYEEGEPYQWFAWTLTDFISQMTLGTISTLSSALILFIIYKSPIRLKSTYHRIMTLLSSFDICFSLSLALATIPMPQSTISYKGPTLGTEGTCIAQGILLQFGAGAIHDTTLCLAGYYVCTALRVNHWKITRIYEPIFYAYIIGINLATTVLTAAKGYINIRHWTTHCSTTPIPSYCWYEESWMEMDDAMAMANNEVDLSKCVWPEEPHFVLTMNNIWKNYILATWILLILAMLVVILVVYENERKLIRENEEETINHANIAVAVAGDTDINDNGNDNSNDNGNGDDEAHDRSKKLEVTHLIIRQAIMYILAFFMTWGIVIIRQDESTPQIYDILDSVLIPLGGVWNMLIFVHIEISHVRSSNSDIDSNFKAFMVLIKEPDTVPEIVLSGMENVQIAERRSEVPNWGMDDGNGNGNDNSNDNDKVDGNDGEDGVDDNLEEGRKSEESSHYTLNPSAYDFLSPPYVPNAPVSCDSDVEPHVSVDSSEIVNELVNENDDLDQERVEFVKAFTTTTTTTTDDLVSVAPVQEKEDTSGNSPMRIDADADAIENAGADNAVENAKGHVDGDGDGDGDGDNDADSDDQVDFGRVRRRFYESLAIPEHTEVTSCASAAAAADDDVAKKRGQAVTTTSTSPPVTKPPHRKFYQWTVDDTLSSLLPQTPSMASSSKFPTSSSKKKKKPQRRRFYQWTDDDVSSHESTELFHTHSGSAAQSVSDYSKQTVRASGRGMGITGMGMGQTTRTTAYSKEGGGGDSNADGSFVSYPSTITSTGGSSFNQNSSFVMDGMYDRESTKKEGNANTSTGAGHSHSVGSSISSVSFGNQTQDKELKRRGGI